MKKTILSIAFAALCMPLAFAVSEPGLTEVWKTPTLEQFKGTWDPAAPDWGKPDAVKAGSNPRFATARDGKMYTINQMTMSIAEITNDGLKDLYKLPPCGEDYYGTAISVDEAGNFLIGKDFVTAESSLKWAVFSPKTNQTKQIDLPIPAGWTIGRQDCVGRVLGDLTKDALFFIAPAANMTPNVRVIKAHGTGTIESVEFETIGAVDVQNSVGSAVVVQPAFTTYSEYTAAGADNYNFYFANCLGQKQNYIAYLNGQTINPFAPDIEFTVKGGTGGFATFVLDGKRYFVRNQGPQAGNAAFGFVVTDENGDALTAWIDETYALDGGYSSIVAEPAGDKANIYIYVSGNKAGAAAMFQFDPAACGAPVIPERPVGATADDPYLIANEDDLTSMGAKIATGVFYAKLTDDINLDGVNVTPIKTTATIYLDGNNHVIKNFNCVVNISGNHGLFDTFTGKVSNLGFENFTVTNNWGCVGALAGDANNFTIDNCYVSGNFTAAGVGAFVGVIGNGDNHITNSYSIANVNCNKNHFGGGLVGRISTLSGTAAKLSVENCYVGGTVTSVNGAGAVGSANCADSEVNIKNFVVWCTSIKGSAGMTQTLVGGVPCKVTVEDAQVYNGTLVNGVAAAELTEMQGTLATDAELIATVKTWEAFNKEINNGRPVLAWQPANGNPDLLGTVNNPYRLSTPADLVDLRNVLAPGDNYLTVENDIDMEGVHYVSPLGNDNFEGVHVFLDGKCHVIKNLAPDTLSNYPSLIGVFMGEIKNLGLVDLDVYGGACGAFGSYTGHKTYPGVTKIDNCYATGKVKGKSYAGGIGGYTNGKTEITNCYTTVDVNGANYAGGVLAWVPAGETTIQYCYASGMVSCVNHGAAGIIGMYFDWDGSSPTVILDNVIAWNYGVKGEKAEPVFLPAVEGETVVNAITQNVYVSEYLDLNGSHHIEGSLSDDDLTEIVNTWPAFNTSLMRDDFFPTLKWESDNSGINDIVVDEVEATDAPAVYYNLQGVQVKNPENGIYIVRRGEKVSKEIVR